MGLPSTLLGPSGWRGSEDGMLGVDEDSDVRKEGEFGPVTGFSESSCWGGSVVAGLLRVLYLTFLPLRLRDVLVALAASFGVSDTVSALLHAWE